jgi:hypothetical protein
MLRETRFVPRLMNLLLRQDLLPPNVQRQVQMYVMEKHRHQKKYLQIQMMIPLVTVMITGMEKIGQMETRTTTKVVKKVVHLCHHLDRLAAIRQRKWRRW